MVRKRDPIITLIALAYGRSPLNGVGAITSYLKIRNFIGPSLWRRASYSYWPFPLLKYKRHAGQPVQTPPFPYNKLKNTSNTIIPHASPFTNFKYISKLKNTAKFTLPN